MVAVAVATAPGGAIAGDEAPHLIWRSDSRLRETGEVVAAMVDVRLEIARTDAEPVCNLRQHTPGEMLVLLEARIPRRQHCRVKPLRVAVRVPRERPHVMRRRHPQAAAGLLVRCPDHEHAPDERQLILREGQRPAPEPGTD